MVLQSKQKEVGIIGSIGILEMVVMKKKPAMIRSNNEKKVFQALGTQIRPIKNMLEKEKDQWCRYSAGCVGESEVPEVDRSQAMLELGRSDRRRSQRGNGELIVWLLSSPGKKNFGRYSTQNGFQFDTTHVQHLTQLIFPSSRKPFLHLAFRPYTLLVYLLHWLHLVRSLC